jgi:hypothetical protein
MTVAAHLGAPFAPTLINRRHEAALRNHCSPDEGLKPNLVTLRSHAVWKSPEKCGTQVERAVTNQHI